MQSNGNLFFIIPTDYFTGILSAYGIILGFLAVIIGLSPKGNEMLTMAMPSIKFEFNLSIGFLVLSVLLYCFQALGVIPSIVTLFVCVLGFYLTCVFLSSTLNDVVFRNSRDVKANA